MAYVPGGTFKMGSAGNEADEFTGHPMWSVTVPGMVPAHSVSVEPFCIDLAPVTVAEYRACAATGACKARPQLDDALCKTGTCTLDQTADSSALFVGHTCDSALADNDERPANCVDWEQAASYCRRDGRRLPTEAEWERAARGTDNRFIAYGPADHAPKTCADALKNEDTCPVAAFPEARSPYGVFDMAFAPSEWTASRYCKYPTHDCDAHDIATRGGLNAWQAVATSRARMSPDAHKTTLTFRCATQPN